MRGVLLPLVLWALAVYHLSMGGAALLAPRRAMAALRPLYGASLPESAALRYATSMIGALALAMGALAAAAALSPADNGAVIAALFALQLCRAFCRLRDRALLAELGVTRRSNLAAVAVLAMECAVLLAGLR
jgi:hypothetical protein